MASTGLRTPSTLCRNLCLLCLHGQESHGGDSCLSRRGGRNEEELVRTCLRGGCEGQVTGLPSWAKESSHSDKELRERIVTGLRVLSGLGGTSGA